VTGNDWSAGLVDDASVSWHAVRGIDLAGLASVLEDGVQPSRNMSPTGWQNAVCVSGSPTASMADGREANSFLAYTMDESSLSLALDAAGSLTPNGGFVDEHRIPGAVPPEAVVGVGANDVLLDTPLRGVAASFEPMKPDRAATYIDRNLALAERTAARAGRALTPRPELREFAARSRSGQALSRQETQQFHATLMGAYSEALATPQRPSPTVRDALASVLATADAKPRLLAWNRNDKRELQSRSARVAHAAAARTATMGFALYGDQAPGPRRSPERTPRAHRPIATRREATRGFVRPAVIEPRDAPSVVTTPATPDRARTPVPAVPDPGRTSDVVPDVRAPDGVGRRGEPVRIVDLGPPRGERTVVIGAFPRAGTSRVPRSPTVGPGAHAVPNESPAKPAALGFAPGLRNPDGRQGPLPGVNTGSPVSTHAVDHTASTQNKHLDEEVDLRR